MQFHQLKNSIKSLLICLCISFNLWAQDNPKGISVKPTQQNFIDEIASTKKRIAQFPKNIDYQFYLAQLYFWSGEPISAQKELDLILIENPNHIEANELWIKTAFTLEQYDDVIRKSKESKNKFRANEDFYSFQEALALEKQDKNEEASEILTSIPENSKLKKDADYLETQILKKKKNTITVGHLFTDFEHSPSALNISHIEYGRKVGRNTFIGRINYGTTDFNNELQTEIDAYLKIKSKSYLYLNTGFAGNNGIFPQYKFGTEYFLDFNKVSSSIGAKYLLFDEDNSTLLFTGHLGLNLKNWKIEYRHYLAETNKDWLSSSILNFRRNFETSESYVQLDLQYGSLPYFFLNNETFQRLSAYRIGINGKIRIQKNYFVQPIFMYEREEFIPDDYRNRYSIQLILSTRF